MRIRRDRQDDLLHPVEAASNFNESRYYNVFDAGCGLGGWMRKGNRPNEGYAELTVCLYLPDGRVGFTYKKPEIEGHTAHDAGGLRFEVVEPYVEHRVTYDGRVLLLDEPAQMADPSQAFADNPRVPCTIDLTHRAVGRPWGGEPEWEEGEEHAEATFARGHTEQHMAVTGTVTVDGETYSLVDGLGLRDHSWGPRSWQSVWWCSTSGCLPGHRWLTGNIGPGLGFAMTVSGDVQGGRHAHGFLYDVERFGDDRLVPVLDVELTSEYDDDGYHRSLHASVRTDDHGYEIDGTVWSSIPLRNRRNGQTTRIAEGMTTWTCEGATGSGLSEYLDQVVDGVPVGVP